MTPLLRLVPKQAHAFRTSENANTTAGAPEKCANVVFPSIQRSKRSHSGRDFAV